MEIHHIRYFLAVCETLNFTRAAEKSGVTQPALSRAILQLEMEIGGQLFRRERNFTHLTDLGMLIRPRLEEIMTRIGGVKHDVRQFLQLQKAGLSLGVMCTIGPQRFTGLLHQFRMRHPGVTLKLLEGVPEMLLQKLVKGDIDVAIMTGAETFPARVNLTRLYRERFVVAFAPGHRFEAHKTVNLGLTEGESYLERLNCEYRGHIDALLDKASINLMLAYESEREDWIQGMVAAGFGIAILPEFSSLATGVLTRHLAKPTIWREICLVSLAGRRQSPAVAAFSKTAKAYKWAVSK